MDSTTTSATPPATAEYRLVRRDTAGVIPGATPTYYTLQSAKRGAIVLNRARRTPHIWWVVADAAGTPLNPQP